MLSARKAKELRDAALIVLENSEALIGDYETCLSEIGIKVTQLANNGDDGFEYPLPEVIKIKNKAFKMLLLNALASELKALSYSVYIIEDHDQLNIYWS